MLPVVKILPNYTYEDYCLWEGRWEVIDGIPYAMSPAPNPRHQMIGAALIGEFRTALKKAGCSHCKVYEFVDFVTGEHTIVQPDVLIVCKPIEKQFLDFPPALVIEILSPSTAMKDRNNKLSIYQSQKIPYYLIVDADKEEIEIYQLTDDRYEERSFNPEEPFTFKLTDNCTSKIKLADIWI